jgi:uncharacterized protein (TIGR00730 family)
VGDRVLLDGRHSRRGEFLLILRAVRDFIAGFRVLHFVGPCVTVFGSERLGESHPCYEVGRQVGSGLARLGFTVMTCGGRGLTKAVNRGAREAGGRSVVCTVDVPPEQSLNPYVDRIVHCRHFFVRKVLLFKYSYAFVGLPGGLDTLDELFEALTLIQTGTMRNFPVVLLGTDFWRPLQGLLDHLTGHDTIVPADLQLLLVTDSLDEALAHIERHAAGRFASASRPFRPSSWLGEGTKRF